MTEEGQRMLARATGTCALAGMVLTWVPVIAVATRGEPSFGATADEVVAFYRSADVAWLEPVGVLALFGMISILWFVVGLTTLLRQAEGEPAWRSTVALLSGTLFVAYGLIDASGSAATNRAEQLDPAVALYAFDIGSLGFANAWVALGSFGVAVGYVLLESRALPAWYAWWIIVAGAGLALSRFAWEQPLWLWPYFAFWPGSPPSASAWSAANSWTRAWSSWRSEDKEWNEIRPRSRAPVGSHPTFCRARLSIGRPIGPGARSGPLEEPRHQDSARRRCVHAGEVERHLRGGPAFGWGSARRLHRRRLPTRPTT